MPPLLAVAPRRLDGGREGAHAVMHHAPDIDEPGGVAFAEGGDRVDDRDGFSAQAHALP